MIALRPYLLALSAVLALTQLSACAPLAIGGAAATTALVATDRRTTGEQIDDKSIDVKVGVEASEVMHKDALWRVDGSSYAGQVLLVGDVPTAADSQNIAARVEKINQVKSVINRLRVGAPTELGVRTNDTWITTKVATALINTKDVPSRTISVTTERGVVYLQGFVTQKEGDLAARAASTVPGVVEVVKLFQHIPAPAVGTVPPAPAPAPAPASAQNPNEPEVFTLQ